MGLFKPGKSKVDYLLTVLIPSLRWEIENEIRQRLAKEMESIVRDEADRALTYGYNGYKEAIKELGITVKAPYKEWVGLTDEEIISSSKFFDYMTNEELIDAVRELEAKLKEKNS